MTNLYPHPRRRRVTVWFKPTDVPPYDASELRSVTFETVGEPCRDDLFQRGCDEAVEQGIIGEYAVRKHWEPFKLKIQMPSQTDEAAEFIGF